MAEMTVTTNPQHDQLLLNMAREMMGQVEDDGELRDVTPEEAKAYWENRFRESVVFFAKKYYNKMQSGLQEEAPDISSL